MSKSAVSKRPDLKVKIPAIPDDLKVESKDDTINQSFMDLLIRALLNKEVDPKMVKFVAQTPCPSEIVKEYKKNIENGVALEKLTDILKVVKMFVININGIQELYSIKMMNETIEDLKKNYVSYVSNGITYFKTEWDFFGVPIWNGQKLPKSEHFEFMFVENKGLYYSDHTNRFTALILLTVDVVGFAKTQTKDVTEMKKPKDSYKEVARKIFIRSEWHHEIIRIIRALNSGKQNIMIYVGPDSDDIE